MREEKNFNNKHTVETIIKLNKFRPRIYQKRVCDALENKNYKRLLVIWPRRAGKDVCAFNLMIRAALDRIGVYYYVFPSYSQARKVIWDSITISGERFLDYIPKELVKSTHIQEMKITLMNGSLLQLVGSDNVDSIVGTNPCGIIFSEYALQDPRAYQYLRPILLVNDGWALFISTVRGKNHMWEMYNVAINHPEDWFVEKLTIEDTGHISVAAIEKEKEEGLMSEDLIMQEYYNDFSLGVEGAYYAKYIDKMRVAGRIGMVPWEAGFKVHTAWDIGVRDSTAIIFFQNIGQTVRIIDCYENSKEGLEHYINVLQGKPYTYGKHIAPHDMKVREFGTGMTRVEKARQLGVSFIIAPDLTITDGIEAVRSAFSKIWIDEKACASLIKALENYRQEFDAKKRVYKSQPLHDSNSHFCFVGDTSVKTSLGDVPIKDITVGMKVVTPLGLRRVLKVHERSVNELCTVTTNASQFTCTPQHQVFNSNGLTEADSLSYMDTLEPYSNARTWVWKKIFGYYGGMFDLEGFKKSILSLRMDRKRSLMDFFIGGMVATTEEELTREVSSNICTEQFGSTIGIKYQRGSIFTMLMGTARIMISRILKSCIKRSISSFISVRQILGHNHKLVKTFCDLKMQKQKNGIHLRREKNGTKSMLKMYYQFLEVSNTIRNVKYAKNSMRVNKFGKNTVLMRAKQSIGSFLEKISFGAIVVFAKLLSFVENTLLKKHAVKSVQLFQCAKAERVYDLTIEHDNSYYANNYLVSNSDAMRYLCISLPKTRDGLSPEDLDKRYQEAMYGTQRMPAMFRDEPPF